MAAPTRWGRVDFSMLATGDELTAKVSLSTHASPEAVHVRFRVPQGSTLRSAAVNRRPATFIGTHKDTVAIAPGSDRHFIVTAQIA